MNHGVRRLVRCASCLRRIYVFSRWEKDRGPRMCSDCVGELAREAQGRAYEDLFEQGRRQCRTS